ncbi:hypothetical protein I79_024470 [Cricetulus griseus]|uniref:Uncharacterized protein n=1 Tax=Cricetulus griseus TaxID=10029 RepID=G3IKR7_CRIGR|nr:hypothetical protein I79_024470 [Cricetulus griseus]
MKGTLLLLALLVTRELGFQKTEERAAFDKILECYNELGLKGKAMDASLMVTSSLSFMPPCTHGTMLCKSDPYSQ